MRGAECVRRGGWRTEAEVTMHKILGERQDRNYGDVDVLAWDSNSRRVLIVECKDVHFRKTYGEVAEQLADFRGVIRENGKPDYLRKHLDRVEILRGNIDAVARFTKVADLTDVESHLVFADPVPLEFALAQMSEQVRISHFDRLGTALVWEAP